MQTSRPALLALLALGCTPSGDEGAPSSGTTGETPAAGVTGEIAGQPFASVGATAQFGDDAVSIDRGYVSVSILDAEPDCSVATKCPGLAANFTLYVIGGRRADVQPGEYRVGGVERDGLTYEVVGAAGAYDDDCGTGDGFSSITSGAVTLDAVVGGVSGAIDVGLADGGTLTGSFSSLDCTP